MSKFQRKQQQLPAPLEAPVTSAEEAIAPGPAESPVVMPKETPVRKVCGINGCTTWYDDPAVMRRHRERQHGVGGPENLNRPHPRNPNMKLA